MLGGVDEELPVFSMLALHLPSRSLHIPIALPQGKKDPGAQWSTGETREEATVVFLR